MIRKRRRLLIGLAAALPFSAVHAQTAARVTRIGYLAGGSPDSFLLDLLRQALQELGYIEGKNIVFEARYRRSRKARSPELAEELVDTELAQELVRMRVDVIVSISPNLTLSAQRATKTIPIVFAGHSDPVDMGLVASLAHPGGNITGLMLPPDLNTKRLELVKEILPNASTVAVLGASGTGFSKAWQSAADALRLRLIPAPKFTPKDYDATFSDIKKAGADAAMMLAVQGAGTPDIRVRLLALAVKNRLPVMYTTREFVDAGGLVSYGGASRELMRRVAYYVDRILKGAKPADLPVEKPLKFELVVNLTAAKQIGLTIPESVLERADAVIR